MQSDVVPGDASKKNVTSPELNASGGVHVTETLVQEKGLGREKEQEGMEIDNLGEGKSRVVSELLSDWREISSLKGKKGSGKDDTNVVDEGSNDACVSKEGKDIGMAAVEGEIKPGSSIKENFKSCAQQLFSNPVNDDRCGKEVESEKTVNGSRLETITSSVQLENQAGMSNKEDREVHVNEEGFFDHKGVNTVDDLDECLRNDRKDGEKKGGFCVSDLVWGKVRSHPWWPGQIFEPGDASDKARKYSKSKGYLVGYFGDQTFAWNHEAKLKPFASNFSQMVKQTNLEAFGHAVGCVLNETSRRVEFGLSCPCIAGDVYNRLKTQVVENTGIRQKSRIREGGDRFFTASVFEPMKFLGYVKDLALGPHTDGDRLEHVVAQAQMAAFYRWKGIYHLAEFGSLIGYVNNEADAPVTAEKEKREVINDGTPPPGIIVEDDARPQKRKKTSSDSGYSIKNVKNLSDLVVKTSARKKNDEETEEKAGSESISSLVRKQKKAKLFPKDPEEVKKNLSDLVVKKSIRKKNDEETEEKAESEFISSLVRKRKKAKLFPSAPKSKESSPLGTTMQSRDTKPSFRVGESILRVAGQLSQPSPLLKLNQSSRGKARKDKGNSKHCDKHNSEYASLDVILSQLRLAAIQPLKQHSLLSNMVNFISHFRNSVVPDTDSELLQKLEDSGVEGTGGKPDEEPTGSGPAEMAEEGCFSGSKSKEKASDSELTMSSDLEVVEDACCVNKITRDPEQKSSLNDVKMTVLEPGPLEVDGVSAGSQEMVSTVSSLQQLNGSENGASEGGPFDEKKQQEDSPTALTLKFSDLDSIPTEAKLNEIFSHFGPLKESETEVLAKKSCARVVFKRRSDAETAFSSSGKFEIFGPSLVCYRLNDAPSSHKSPTVEAKRRKKDYFQ